jgi:hypothetical protein
MAQSIRVSDELHRLAADVGAVQGRSLAQQVEYWVRLGIALDAAGLTTAQAMTLQCGDANALKQAGALLSTGGLGGLPAIEAFHRRVDQEVAQGLRSAESCLAFTAESSHKYRVQFTAEPDLVQAW